MKNTSDAFTGDPFTKKTDRRKERLGATLAGRDDDDYDDEHETCP